MAVMGSPHGWMFSAKQAYHVSGPLPFNPLDQLAETKVGNKFVETTSRNQTMITGVLFAAIVSLIMFITPNQQALAIDGNYTGLKLPCPGGSECVVSRGGPKPGHGTGRHAVDFTMRVNRDVVNIHAVKGGTVNFVGWGTDGSGYHLIIDNGDNYCTLYYWTFDKIGGTAS